MGTQKHWNRDSRQSASLEREERERGERREMSSFSSDSEFLDAMRSPSFLSEGTETLEVAVEKNPQSGFKEKDPWLNKKMKKKKNQVFLEGYVETGDEEDEEQRGLKGVSRTKSLTDEDLDELKGCLDLGFGFNYEEIPELCNTLPALELCYSMSQRFLDDQNKAHEAAGAASIATETCSSSSGPIANWKISSPGDHPEEVKARLKYWAQAVACTVKLCN